MKKKTPQASGTAATGLQAETVENRTLSAEAALRESEERYRKLLEILPSAILIHTDGRMLFMNRTGLAMFGARDLSDIVGLPILEYVHPDYREASVRRMMDIFRSGATLEPVEEVLLDLTGRPLRCLVNSAMFSYQGRPAMIVSVTDITALKEYERSLSRYHHIVSASRECLAFIDRSGTIEALNAAMATTLGRGVDESVGTPFIEFMAPASRHDPGRLKDLVVRALAGEEINDESLLDIPGLGHRHVELSLTPFIEGGAPVGCIVFLRDITGTAQTAQRMLSAIQETREKVGIELHEGLSHHLLGVAIKSRLLAERLAALDSDLAAEASGIEASVNSAIEEARRLAMGLTPVDLEHLNLAASLHEIAAGLEKLGGLRCTVTIDDRSCAIGPDQSVHLHYIVREAAANILKHARARTVAISLKTDGPFSTLLIRDDGIGITVPRDRQGPGSGMGLTIMRYRALLIGASFTIANIPGGGTEIRCRFGTMPAGTDGAVPHES